MTDPGRMIVCILISPEGDLCYSLSIRHAVEGFPSRTWHASISHLWFYGLNPRPTPSTPTDHSITGCPTQVLRSEVHLKYDLATSVLTQTRDFEAAWLLTSGDDIPYCHIIPVYQAPQVSRLTLEHPTPKSNLECYLATSVLT